MASFSTTHSRWAALQSRDPLAANAFIYSVITTKIYCRPTCSSRLARRANILFHNTAANARAHGFRACKRCQPDNLHNQDNPQKIAIAKACGLLREESENAKWSVKGLATEVGLTESHFCRVFKKELGLTVGEYRGYLLLEKIHVPPNNYTNLSAQLGRVKVHEGPLNPFIKGDEYENRNGLMDSMATHSGLDWKQSCAMQLCGPDIERDLTSIWSTTDGSPGVSPDFEILGDIQDIFQFVNFDAENSVHFTADQ